MWMIGMIEPIQAMIVAQSTTMSKLGPPSSRMCVNSYSTIGLTTFGLKYHRLTSLLRKL